jgi:hypothetical protein
LSYDSKAAFSYAEKWCQQGNDCESGQYRDENNTDCAHFISHVLNAGGVSVKGAGAQCKSGLCIRVKELGEWFSSATQKYSNVKRISSWKEAKRGDLCFQRFVLVQGLYARKYHVMFLADAPTSNGARVYGHENNRCGQFVEFDVDDCVYYRISPPLDGTWISTDQERRFTLKIDGASVAWTERRPSGTTLTRNVELTALPGLPEGKFRISRPNDEEVLVFLDFPDSVLRKEILLKNPEASTLDVFPQGSKLVAAWHGLLVRKLPNGRLKEIVQPSQIQTKLYEFRRK